MHTYTPTRIFGSWDVEVLRIHAGHLRGPSVFMKSESSTEFGGVREHTNNSCGWGNMALIWFRKSEMSVVLRLALFPRLAVRSF